MPSKPKRVGKPKPNNREKNGRTPHDPTRPIGNKNPPVETQIKPGEVRNPLGRPRRLKDLQELILATLAEEAGGNMTRAELLIRTMLVKSPSDRIALLEYVFGKVTQPYANVDWREEARKQGIDPDAISTELVDQFTTAMARTSESGSVADRQSEDSK